MMKETGTIGITQEDEQRFEDIRNRAQKLGVLDINFSGMVSCNVLDCYEQTLDIIEEHKAMLDQNAGEA